MKKLIAKLLADVPTSLYETATCFAPTNIALIKYWGKRCLQYNLPMTDSLSLTLPDFGSTTTLRCHDHEHDTVTMNGTFAVYTAAMDGTFAVYTVAVNGTFAFSTTAINGTFAVYTVDINGTCAVYTMAINGTFAVCVAWLGRGILAFHTRSPNQLFAGHGSGVAY